MINWKVIIDNKLPGAVNMQKDLDLFNNCKEPTLRIYGWNPPCISLGYSQDINEYIYVEKAKALGWDTVKRPTGGGIVFHNSDEVTYSVVCPLEVMPKGAMEAYYYISEKIVLALSKLGVKSEIRSTKSEGNSKFEIRNSKSELCFATAREFEITVDGRKLVGSAQKRNRTTMLQHGSIQVAKNNIDILGALKNGSDTRACLDSIITIEEILKKLPSFNEISAALTSVFQ